MTALPSKLTNPENPSLNRWCLRAACVLGLGIQLRTHAAPPPAPAPGDEIKSWNQVPNSSGPEFNADILDPQKASPTTMPATRPPSTPRSDEPYYENDRVYGEKASIWARPSVGAYGLYTNHALSGAWFKRTQDTILLSHMRESGIGVGAFLDFNTPAMKDEALRFGIGLVKFSLSPDDSVNSVYTPGQLESSLGVFQVSLLYRLALNYFGNFQSFWVGAGGQLNYIISSSRPDAGGNPASNLAGSFGLSPTVAIGADIPLSSWNDLVLDAAWHPPGGFSLHAGIRTSL